MVTEIAKAEAAIREARAETERQVCVEMGKECEHKMNLLKEEQASVRREEVRRLEQSQSQVAEYGKTVDELKAKVRHVEKELTQEQEATLELTTKLTDATAHLHRLQVVVKERDQQISMQNEAIKKTEMQGLSLQHANHTLTLAKKEAEERSRAFHKCEEDLAAERTKVRELEAAMGHEKRQCEALQQAADAAAKELREVLPVLDRKTQLSQSLQHRVEGLEKENSEMQRAIEELSGENSSARTQLVVLKDLRRDRERMRRTSQGMWLLYNKNVPKLRADLVNVRGTVMHDITDMRSFLENGIQKLQHAYTDMLVKV